jgi:hypothetical protein
MKFLITKDLAHSRLIVRLMTGVIIAIMLYLCMDALVHAYMPGLAPDALMHTLYGDSVNFEEPVLFDTLLQRVHADLFMTLVTLLILSSVYIRFFGEQPKSKFLVHLLFITGMLAPLSLAAAYFWGSLFAYVWLVLFGVWHAVALWGSVRVLVVLFKRR